MKENPFRYFSIASLKELINVFRDSPRQSKRNQQLFELLDEELEKQLKARDDVNKERAQA